MKTSLTRAIAIVGVSIILGLSFDRLFFNHGLGLSFPVYVAGLAGGIVALAYYLGHKPSQAAWWLMLPLLGFASLVAVRSSDSLTVMNLGACLMLLLLIAKVAFRRRLADLRVIEYLKLPLLPLQFFAPAGRTLGQIVATHRIIKTKPITRQVVMGIALTLPILVVFLLLFASADLVVQKYLAEIISFQIDEELTARVILILLATLGLTGGYSYMFGSTAAETVPTSSTKPRLGKVESTILLGSVNTLFFAFILVQLTYLFGGQVTISDLGLTYAEYARKGFFELLTVAVVAFGLLWWAEKLIIRAKQGHTALFKILSIALVLQVIAIMGSAFRRLYLYEQAYGFTSLRLYSHAFTVLLAVIFTILAYKIIRSASDRAFALPALLAVITFLAALNAINPDAFIARQNLDRYRQTGKIDSYYLGRLSHDAVPELVGAYPSLQPDDAAALGQELNRRRLKAEARTNSGWQSWNYGRETADTALAGEAPKLKAYPMTPLP